MLAVRYCILLPRSATLETGISAYVGDRNNVWDLLK